MQSRVIPIAETTKENMAVFHKSDSRVENILEMGLYACLQKKRLLQGCKWYN